MKNRKTSSLSLNFIFSYKMHSRYSTPTVGVRLFAFVQAKADLQANQQNQEMTVDGEEPSPNHT